MKTKDIFTHGAGTGKSGEKAGPPKVKNVMTKGIEGIQSSDSVQHAALRMKELDIGSLAVFDHDSIVGMLTDRDIVTKVLGSHRNPEHTKIGDVMSRQPVICDEDTTLEQAAQLMQNHAVRRLLIKNEANQISGILTVDDIALRGKEKDILVVDVIRKVKQRIGPKR
jgi:CBS domain-containing protein